MSTLLMILVTAAITIAVLAYTGVYVARVIKDDGAHGPRRTPPGSHHADAFDPRSRLA